MRVFILKFDGTVEVVDSYSDHAHYTNINYPKGQLFLQRSVGIPGSAKYLWNALHRDHKGNGSSWQYAADRHVPEAVRFARMLVD